MPKELQYKDSVTTDQLKAMFGSGMKQVNIRDVAGRIEVLYEAPLSASIGSPCVRTKYKYLDGAGGTSRKIIAYEEEVVGWPGYEIVSVGAGDDIDLVP